jgi:hypothetical protein
MNIIFYAAENEGAELQFWELSCDLTSEFPDHNIETCHSLDALTQKLLQTSFEPDVAVLLARNHRDFLDILALKDLLDNKRVILILPDRSEITISQGHKLHPRYLSYADSDFKDVAAVLKKMIKHLDTQHIVLENPIPCGSSWVNLEHISFRSLSEIEPQKCSEGKQNGARTKKRKPRHCNNGRPNGELPDILPG